MQEVKTMQNTPSREVLDESKSEKSDSHGNAVTLEYVEDEPAPHLHLKTFLIVAVSLYRVMLSVPDN